MENVKLTTAAIKNEAERCEDEKDILELLRVCEGYYVSWQKYINQLMEESGFSYNRAAELCRVSKNTIKRWCTSPGVPRSRDLCLKTAFGFGLDSAETDFMLTRYGGYHRLCETDLFDRVCAYMLDRRGDWEDARRLCERCRTLLAGGEEEYPDRVHGKFIAGVLDDAGRFGSCGAKLRDYVWHTMIGGQLPDEGRSVSAICRDRGIPQRFRLVLFELYQGRIPRRERLIALGLFLDMTADELDYLLELAGMEPLCARNRLECVLIYALQRMALMHPELPLSNAIQLLSTAGDEDTLRRCRALVEEYTKKNYRCADEDLDSVAAYVRGTLEKLDMEEAAEFLELI